MINDAIVPKSIPDDMIDTRRLHGKKKKFILEWISIT
tara:strand:- start:526 stop:636 length:111 start_codon:yes stop_codon:yes gene_type:complete